jgi:hypothetical protein
MASVSKSAPDPAEQSHWLYGRTIDLLVGCCGIYTLSIPFLLALTASTGISEWSVTLTMLLGVSINAPHYGATLVRLYEREQDRRKYFFFTVYVTLALSALFVIATHNVWLASALITAYVIWSPWHFSAQNYGLLLMFLRREGIAFDDTTKRLFYASFVASTLMSIESVQAANSELVFAPATFRAPGTARIFQWELLQIFASPILWVLGGIYSACLAGALFRLRASGFRIMGPATLLIVTQALFTAVPVAAGRIYSSGEITVAFAPLWISIAHSAQYLWVSAYFAKRSGAQKSSARFLGKSLLAGSGVTVLPGLLFAPAVLGEIPWDAGLAGLVFSMVNLHHFIMDGAIWKLRDGRVSNVLLRQTTTPDAIGPRTGNAGWKWLAALIWTGCSLSVMVPLIHLYEIEVRIPNAATSDDITLAMKRMRAIGRESISLQNHVASVYSGLDQPGLALQHYQQSIDVFPTPDAWTAIANEYRRTGYPDRARSAFDKALELDPDFASALFGYATALAIDNPVPPPADRARALQMLRRLIELHPGQSEVEKALREIER